MRLFTIGFTRKSAETFFSALKNAGISRLIDVRLNNVSQLAGFTKRDDLAYFTRTLCGVPYEHMPALAPTAELLAGLKKGTLDWSGYERAFADLMVSRKIEQMPRATFDGACLLCSEPAPHHCHRRIVAEHLSARWKDVAVTHL